MSHSTMLVIGEDAVDKLNALVVNNEIFDYWQDFSEVGKEADYLAKVRTIGEIKSNKALCNEVGYVYDGNIVNDCGNAEELLAMIGGYADDVKAKLVDVHQ